MGVRSFGLVLADDAFGRDTLLGIERVMSKLELAPTARVKVDNRNPVVTEAVRTMAASRPEVVLLILSAKAGSDYVKAYRQQGARAPYVSLSNTSNNNYVQALGDAARGCIFIQMMPSPFSAVTGLARDYGTAAQRAKQPLSYAGMYGYAQPSCWCWCWCWCWGRGWPGPASTHAGFGGAGAGRAGRGGPGRGSGCATGPASARGRATWTRP
ncbi:MAG: ABC transporter substrate-binding protein [Burkholderiaceae bacterium]|nr:ABC transporter substrate-binding protein [Burkholderiaceae bacterium]